MKKKRVLFSPLNWGLGHAVRSVPILREFAACGFEVILAGDGVALEYLHNEFPDWQCHIIPSFKIDYSKGNSQIIPVLKALPKIVIASWKEYRQLKHWVKEWNIDIVISDNRFGFFYKSRDKQVISIYITHQLTVRMPSGFRFLEPVVRRLHRAVISNYTYCWIPDEAGSINLSGDLSHNQPLPKNAHFIGILSRFQKEKFPDEKSKLYDFLFILSGPEPQRTILEEKITGLFNEKSNVKAMLVRGISRQRVSEQQKDLTASEQLQIIDQASSCELERLLSISEVVVCRSGYTSVMELASISKRAVLIPTPGQPEQEYLGEYLSGLPLFACVKQDELTMAALLHAAQK